MVKVLPPPISDEIVSRPRCRLTMCLTIASPSPVPPRDRLSCDVHPVEPLGEARQMLGRYARAEILHRQLDPVQPPSRTRPETTIRRPELAYLIAFSIRFWTT